jgi:DNA-binding response OmpR family regulator
VEQVPADVSRWILIVEDNVDAGESLQMLMAMGGYDVRLAQDGESALKIAKEFGPEVVVLDLGLPNMDGYEVVQRLRAHASAVRPVVVALTGYGQPEDRRRTQEAGFDNHLLKPLAPEELMAIVASLGSTPPGGSG